jgi:hypothetical protein
VLAPRLSEREAPVQLAAMRTVVKLATSSGTFMTQRLANDAVPSLCRLLRTANAAVLAHGGTGALSGDRRVGVDRIATGAAATATVDATKTSRFLREYKLELGALKTLNTLALTLGRGGASEACSGVGSAAAWYTANFLTKFPPFLELRLECAFRMSHQQTRTRIGRLFSLISG